MRSQDCVLHYSASCGKNWPPMSKTWSCSVTEYHCHSSIPAMLQVTSFSMLILKLLLNSFSYSYYYSQLTEFIFYSFLINCSKTLTAGSALSTKQVTLNNASDYRTKGKKGKGTVSRLQRNSMTQLRSVTRHMVLYGVCMVHSVTFYPTQVNAPRLHPSQTGWYSIYRPFKDGGLSKSRPRVQRATGQLTLTLTLVCQPDSPSFDSPMHY